MNDLIRFLLARIDEDESELKTLHRRQSRGAKPVEDVTGVRSLRRLRAECAAKRELIGGLQHLLVLRDQPQEKPVRDAATHMLFVLARPYAEHPGYRTGWESGQCS